MRWLRQTLMSVVQLPLHSWGPLVLLCACAAGSGQRDMLGQAAREERVDWIKVGQTTREEVVERYGQPDLVLASDQGEVVLYRPRDPSRSTPRMEIPTVHPGPFGTATTKMEPINPDLGTRPMNSGYQQRPEQELRIRYNAQGIVRELIP